MIQTKVKSMVWLNNIFVYIYGLCSLSTHVVRSTKIVRMALNITVKIRWLMLFSLFKMTYIKSGGMVLIYWQFLPQVLHILGLQTLVKVVAYFETKYISHVYF